MMRFLSLVCIAAIPLCVMANDLPTTADFGPGNNVSKYTPTPPDPFAIVWTAKATNTACPVSRTAGDFGSDGKYHLVCGNCQLHSSHPNERVWDPVANTWTDGLTRPTAGVHNNGAVAAGTKIYAGGGSSGAAFTDDFTAIDLVANTWTVVGTMPVASLLYYEMATAGNGRVYCLGGATGGTTVINQNWEYDPVGNAWTQKANMPAAMRDVAAAGVGDTVYICGGTTTYPTALNTLHKYSISGNTYSSGPAMPGPLFWSVGMVTTHRDSGPQVVVLGGQSGTGFLNVAYRYNIRGGYWVTETPMLLTRRSHAAGARANRWLFPACGWNGAFVANCEEGAPSFVGVEGQSEPSIRDNIGLAVSPNPFASRTVVSYTLSRTQNVEVNLYDVSGKLVANLVSGSQGAGTHSVVYNGRDLNSGVYFVELKTGTSSRTEKVILAR